MKSKGSFKDVQFFHDFNDMLQMVNKRNINHLLIIMPSVTSTRRRLFYGKNITHELGTYSFYTPALEYNDRSLHVTLMINGFVGRPCIEMCLKFHSSDFHLARFAMFCI